MVNFDAVWLYPKPAQQPDPPILLGGSRARAASWRRRGSLSLQPFLVTSKNTRDSERVRCPNEEVTRMLADLDEAAGAAAGRTGGTPLATRNQSCDADFSVPTSVNGVWRA